MLAAVAEVAAGFKAQANELFAARKFRDALGFYTQAIVECGKELPVEELRVLWCNRAATNLELGPSVLCSRWGRRADVVIEEQEIMGQRCETARLCSLLHSHPTLIHLRLLPIRPLSRRYCGPPEPSCCWENCWKPRTP